VYGFKASFGRVPMVSRPNAFSTNTPFVFEGVLTRTVGDAALGLTALAGYDSRDPLSLDQPIDPMASLNRSVKGMRIAYSPNLDVFPVDPDVANCVANAVKAFEDAGASVEHVRLNITRPQRELSDVWCRLIMALNLTALEQFKRGGLDLLRDHAADFPPEYHAWVQHAYRMSLLDFLKDQEVQTEIYDAIQGVLNTYDLLITPTLACTAVDNTDDGNTKGPTQIQGEAIDPLIGWCLTYLVNFTGHPAASIPAGLTDRGLPVGMQIIGRRYADDAVLGASAVFERIKPWRQTYDRCAQRAV
jgi:amidase